ncbi:MAG: DNA polymerase A family protein, partial [Cellulosilyticaceae bacterium]
EVEIPVITTLANMELRGVQLDADFAKQLKIDYTAKLKEVESYIYQFIYSHDLTCLDETVLKKLDDPINLGSSTQMAIIFYDLLKLPIVSRDKPRSTASEILDELIIKLNPVQKLNEVVAFLENLKQHRGLNKLLSGFIESLPQQVCPVTNKIHAKNNATGTVTGRMSMSEPNLQQIPSKNKDIRKLFVADKDHLLIGLDYSQEEPRILAHLSQDKHLLDTYSKGIDIYAQSASLTFNIPYDECKEFDAEGRLNPEGKKRRNSMKSVILGKMYGRGPKSIAEQLGIKAKEAQVIVDNFDMTFPGVKKLIDKECAFASAYGYVETVYGRKRRLPDMQLENSAYNDKRIRKASRQVLNSIIQGTGGDIVKKALIALDNDTFLNEKGYQLLFSVHDEILGQAPEDVALECARRMKEIMIQVPSDRILVPFKVDGEIMRRWTDENLLEVWGETL